MPSRTFFNEIEPFENFSGFTDPANFHSLPDDWHVVIADVKGSTEAIRKGRYRDINMIGGACITAVLNAVKDFSPKPEIPYVFGGDGATFAIPDVALTTALQALVRLRNLCFSRFALFLRIGFVLIAEIRAHDRDVRVAKLLLSPGNSLALFDGGGMEWADRRIKDPVVGRHYQAESKKSDDLPDLSGLSCRWSYLKSTRGHIVTLLVLARRNDRAVRAQTYRKTVRALNDILGADMARFSPVNENSLQFRWPPKSALTEARMTAGHGTAGTSLRLLFILFQSAIQKYLHSMGRKAGDYDAPIYEKELVQNSDFRRFDDVLRLVLDCEEAHVEQIETKLEELRNEDAIFYGIHVADLAMMTCLVFDLTQAQHLHFLDGGEGGFVAAATQLKKQILDDREINPIPDEV